MGRRLGVVLGRRLAVVLGERHGASGSDHVYGEETTVYGILNATDSSYSARQWGTSQRVSWIRYLMQTRLITSNRLPGGTARPQGTPSRQVKELPMSSRPGVVR